MSTDLNIDPKEIQAFERISHQWWDEQGDFKALHRINPHRLAFIERYCCVAESKVLDIGCGGGILSEALAYRGATVTGIDMCQGSIDAANLHLLESKLDIDYRLISAEEFARHNPNQFDVITCMEMLEHVPDPQSIIKACYDLVKPNGYVFFSTINRTAKAYLLMILGAEHVLNMVPKGTHCYEKFIKPSELARCARTLNFTIKELTGLTYNPLSDQFSLVEDDVDVNYFMCVQKHS